LRLRRLSGLIKEAIAALKDDIAALKKGDQKYGAQKAESGILFFEESV